MRKAYVLITNSKAHVYGSHSTALRIYNRAMRMKVKSLEFVQATVKTGDLYRRSSKVKDSDLVQEPFGFLGQAAS